MMLPARFPSCACLFQLAFHVFGHIWAYLCSAVALRNDAFLYICIIDVSCGKFAGCLDHDKRGHENEKWRVGSLEQCLSRGLQRWL